MRVFQLALFLSFFFFSLFSVSISFVHITQTQPNGFISFLGKRHVNSSAFTMKLKMESAAKKIFCILLVEIRRSFLFTSKTSVKWKLWAFYLPFHQAGTKIRPLLNQFLDAFSHLYKRLCPPVRSSVGHTRVGFLENRICQMNLNMIAPRTIP